jgi:hypothetical protein
LAAGFGRGEVDHDHSKAFALEVTDGMFDFMEDRFETPAAEEEAVERRNG